MVLAEIGLNVAKIILGVVLTWLFYRNFPEDFGVRGTRVRASMAAFLVFAVLIHGLTNFLL